MKGETKLNIVWACIVIAVLGVGICIGYFGLGRKGGGIKIADLEGKLSASIALADKFEGELDAARKLNSELAESNQVLESRVITLQETVAELGNEVTRSQTIVDDIEGILVGGADILDELIEYFSSFTD